MVGLCIAAGQFPELVRPHGLLKPSERGGMLGKMGLRRRYLRVTLGVPAIAGDLIGLFRGEKPGEGQGVLPWCREHLKHGFRSLSSVALVTRQKINPIGSPPMRQAALGFWSSRNFKN